MIGRLNMSMELGTIMGPNTGGEFVTAYESLSKVDGSDYDGYTTFRHTQTKDFSGVPASGPRSVTEHRLMGVQQSVFGPIRCDPIEYRHPADDGKVYGGEILVAKKVRPEEPIRLKQGRGKNGR